MSMEPIILRSFKKEMKKTSFGWEQTIKEEEPERYLHFILIVAKSFYAHKKKLPKTYTILFIWGWHFPYSALKSFSINLFLFRLNMAV